jgi:hypothetical protein
MDDAKIKQLCRLLSANERREIVDGLKALRSLNAPQTVPMVLPLLNSPQENGVRDCCRTLTVLGNKEIVSSVEPLLSNSNAANRKDAQDAIDKLRAKP